MRFLCTFSNAQQFLTQGSYIIRTYINAPFYAWLESFFLISFDGPSTAFTFADGASRRTRPFGTVIANECAALDGLS